jgi:hypothetical protein
MAGLLGYHAGRGKAKPPATPRTRNGATPNMR